MDEEIAMKTTRVNLLKKRLILMCVVVALESLMILQKLNS
jgi:hypothetical protein